MPKPKTPPALRCALALLLGLPALAQMPGLYLKIGGQLEKPGHWDAPRGPAQERPFRDGFNVDEGATFRPIARVLNRWEAGAEWAISPTFGFRAGLATLRFPDEDYSWKAGFLDLLWTPWRSGHRRAFVSAGLGIGSLTGTYMVQKEGNGPANGTTPAPYLPGDYRRVDQSGRLFLRFAYGFQFNRYLAVEMNVDMVNLQSGQSDPWPATAFNAGANLVLRVPIQ